MKEAGDSPLEKSPIRRRSGKHISLVNVRSQVRKWRLHRQPSVVDHLSLLNNQLLIYLLG